MVNGQHEYIDSILMMYDFSNFTALCDSLEQKGHYDQFAEFFLNALRDINQIIKEAGGTPHNFTGDGFISSFPKELVGNSLDSALAIKEFGSGYNTLEGIGLKELLLQISVYKGFGLYGMIPDGGYSPFGRAPSKLTRLEEVANASDIIVLGSIAEPVMDQYIFERLPGFSLRGIRKQKEIYRLLDRR